MQDKKQKNITANRLENVALNYLAKYDSSAANLKAVLKRRVCKAQIAGAEVPENTTEMIDGIVAKMVRLGYIDDARFAENLMRKMANAGKSKMQIRQKMAKSGVTDGALVADYDEEAAAALFVCKKHLGLEPSNYLKDLAKLARAGFSREVAEKALGSN